MARDFGLMLERCASRMGGADARRLFHGRGRCYPGFEDLVVDWWPPYMVVGWFAPAADEAVALDVGELAGLTDGLAALDGVQGVLVQIRQGPRTRVETAHGTVVSTFPATSGSTTRRRWRRKPKRTSCSS